MTLLRQYTSNMAAWFYANVSCIIDVTITLYVCDTVTLITRTQARVQHVSKMSLI